MRMHMYFTDNQFSLYNITRYMFSFLKWVFWDKKNQSIKYMNIIWLYNRLSLETSLVPSTPTEESWSPQSVCSLPSLPEKPFPAPSGTHSTHFPFIQSFFTYCLLIHGVFEDSKTGSSSLPSSVFISTIHFIFCILSSEAILYSHCSLLINLQPLAPRLCFVLSFQSCP